MSAHSDRFERFLDRFLEGGAGEAGAVALVHGDLVLAEPAAQRVAAAIAQRAGCEVETHRQPARLAPILEDLRTFAMFVPAKVALCVGSGLLADRAGAAGLIDDAAASLPAPAADADLGSRGRAGAARLLQALRLFGVRPETGDPETLIAALPDWALQGGAGRKGRGRSKGEVTQLRTGLAALLIAARAAEIVGWAEGDLAELGSVVAQGLPPGHALVLAESAAASDHPIVAALAARGAVLDVGSVERERGGEFSGLDLVAAELERQTGVAIGREALAELARRTLRQDEERGRTAEGLSPDSTARLAGEYRKLAQLAGAEDINIAMVEDTVADRGQEDVWQLLDAIAAGRGGEALERHARLQRVADDPIAARLSFFTLLAGFARQLTAVSGLLEATKAPRGEQNYNAFKTKIVQRLQADLPDGTKSPVAGLHPFRLHRVYLAASRLSGADATGLPWRVLETELRLKGESGDPDTALAEFVATLAGQLRSKPNAATARSPRSR